MLENCIWASDVSRIPAYLSSHSAKLKQNHNTKYKELA